MGKLAPVAVLTLILLIAILSGCIQPEQPPADNQAPLEPPALPSGNSEPDNILTPPALPSGTDDTGGQQTISPPPLPE